MIDGDFVRIIEEIIPGSRIESKTIMENKVCLWSVLLNKAASLSVEVFQKIQWSIRPWFIDWFKSTKSWVWAPSFEKILTVFETQVDVVLVDVIILLVDDVPRAQPVGSSKIPMTEVVIVNPHDLSALSTIIITILRILNGMNIQ